MPLPSSGPISAEQIRNEFGGPTTFSMASYYRHASPTDGLEDFSQTFTSVNNSSVPTSGQISFADFYSKFREVLYVVGSPRVNANTSSFFGGYWATNVLKRLRNNSNIVSNSSGSSALTVSSSLNSILAIENPGNVLGGRGSSGAPNGGAGGTGGTAIEILSNGCTISNSNLIAAGGGGGGAGGRGGNGGQGGGGYYSQFVGYSGCYLYAATYFGCSGCPGGWADCGCVYVGGNVFQHYCNPPVYNNVYTTGGNGGNGGNGGAGGLGAGNGGFGDNGSGGSGGSGGSAGGVNAGTGGAGGTGGTGGNGGNFGSPGSPGSPGSNGNTGENGNNGGGLAGSGGGAGGAGGAGGVAIKVSSGISYTLLSNTGQILGSSGGGASAGFNLISGNVSPRFGSGISGFPSGYTAIFNGNSDDAFVGIPLGFNWNISNNLYSSVYVGSNTYITFGSGSSVYSGLNASNPALPKLHLGSSDNSFQKVSYLATSQSVIIRYEGMASASGSGAIVIIYEATFFNPSSVGGNSVVEVRFGTHGRTGGQFGIANASTYYALSAFSENTSYVFYGNPNGTSYTIYNNHSMS